MISLLLLNLVILLLFSLISAAFDTIDTLKKYLFRPNQAFPTYVASLLQLTRWFLTAFCLPVILWDKLA